MKKYIILSAVLASTLFASKIDFELANKDAQRVYPDSIPNSILSYNASIKDAKQSVVNISTSKTIKSNYNEQMDDFFNNPFFQDFFGHNFDFPQESDRKSSSLGSGVIISSDGYIVTNYHVIDGADEIKVTLLGSSEEYNAKVIGSDSKTDIAIIKIEKTGLKAIKFADSSNLLEGDVVFAIGNPFGVGETITKGIISALNKNNIGLNQYENFIQTDASINPGNSGGALVDSRGALVGINSAILSRSGGANGIGFAIPSNMVKDVATMLIEDGKIERGYIGVNITDLTKEQKEIYKNKEGSLIANVEKDKPADKAGLKRGDLIIKLNDKQITSSNELKNSIGALKPGTSVDVTFERDGKIKTTKIKLAQLPLDKEDSSISSNSNTDVKGLSVSNLTNDTKKRLRLDDSVKGVLVTEVDKNSDASKAGFMKMDIIVQIGQEEIKDVDDFNKAMKRAKGNKTLVWVIRNGITQGIVIK